MKDEDLFTSCEDYLLPNEDLLTSCEDWLLPNEDLLTSYEDWLLPDEDLFTSCEDWLLPDEDKHLPLKSPPLYFYFGKGAASVSNLLPLQKLLITK